MKHWLLTIFLGGTALLNLYTGISQITQVTFKGSFSDNMPWGVHANILWPGWLYLLFAVWLGWLAYKEYKNGN